MKASKKNHISKKNVTSLGEHVFHIPNHVSNGDNVIYLDQTPYSRFRNNIYIDVFPGQLPQEDIMAINKHCDADEGAANESVKTVIANSLSDHFGDATFRLYEIGCGHYPITPYFNDSILQSYVGIDPDELAQQQAKKDGYTVCDWENIESFGDLPRDSISVATSVYALHFLANEELPKRIKNLIGEDGFFVANLYRDSKERQGNFCHNFLKNLFSKNSMPYQIIDDPSVSGNEYWIVGNNQDISTLNAYSNTLQKTLHIQ